MNFERVLDPPDEEPGVERFTDAVLGAVRDLPGPVAGSGHRAQCDQRDIAPVRSELAEQGFSAHRCDVMVDEDQRGIAPAQQGARLVGVGDGATGMSDGAERIGRAMCNAFVAIDDQ